MKGEEYEYRQLLALVTSMDLSSNNLIGEIPEELTSLYGLRFLNLSNNQLHGKIPEKINAMKYWSLSMSQ
jgi:Leucine-rich repeat (LRR) protein